MANLSTATISEHNAPLIKSEPDGLALATDLPAIVFHKAYLPAPDICRADKSASGTLPAAAFQYCEALRQASALGWYVYPPKDIHLLFDGHESFYHEDDQWYPVKSASFEDDFKNHWQSYAPPQFADRDPPWLSEIFVPGIIQIWSGFFVTTRPGVNLLIRPPVNYSWRSSFSCFEGLVETDSFSPMPLFINIKLTATNREIFIPSYKPLFQVIALPSQIISLNGTPTELIELGAETGKDFDWQGFAGTIRSADNRQSHRPGRYAAKARKHTKHQGER